MRFSNFSSGGHLVNWSGTILNVLVERNFIAGRPQLFHCWPSQDGTSVLVLHGFSFISIVATCIAAHFALCHAL